VAIFYTAPASLATGAGVSTTLTTVLADLLSAPKMAASQSDSAFWIDLPLAGLTAQGFAAEQLYQNLISSEDGPSCDHYLFFPSSL
jgi:hypothetical protein